MSQQRLAFPIVLSVSPVQEAFPGIQWDSLGKVSLSHFEKCIIRAGEDNVLEYTIFHNQEDTSAYVDILLKILDNCIAPGNPDANSSKNRVARLPFESVLSEDEAVQFLESDHVGVMKHFTISKLCDIVQCLQDTNNNSSKITMSSTFFPDGILIDNWRPLLRVLHGGNTDIFAQRGASFCLSCIFLEGWKLQEKNQLFASVSRPLESFVSWTTSRLQSSASKTLSVVAPALTVIIMSPAARQLFSRAGGVGYICRYLHPNQHMESKSNINGQQLYELCYCLWVMSFDCKGDEDMQYHFHRDGAVPSLADLIIAKPREKIVRLALSTLRNLALLDTTTSKLFASRRNLSVTSHFLIEMIGCGLMKSVDFLMERIWSDQDIIDDLRALLQLLHDTYKELSRWDVYEAEIESTHLQWGVVHTEAFFQENAKRMEGRNGDFSIVKDLIRLTKSESDDVAAIACFDIGEFVRYYPNGKHIAKRLGAREAVLACLEHENVEVQRHALTCISKLLVNNWKVPLS